MIKYKLLSIILYIIFLPTFVFSSIFLIIVGLIHLPLFYKIDKFLCRIILLTLCSWPKILGKFPDKGTYIIMMKHSSFIDVFLFPLIPKGAYSGVTAKGNFKIPVFSTLIKRIKAIPIDRSNRTSAISSIKQAEKILTEGIHIGILPEGTRTLNGLIGTIKKGGVHMAINTNTSIVPVGVIGAFNFKPKNRWWIVPNKITLNIGEVIDINKYKDASVNSIKEIIGDRLKQLSNEDR